MVGSQHYLHYTVNSGYRNSQDLTHMSLFTPHAEPGRQPCRLLQAAAQQLALKSHRESKPEHPGTGNQPGPKSAWHRPHSTPRLSASPLLVFCIGQRWILVCPNKRHPHLPSCLASCGCAWRTHCDPLWCSCTEKLSRGRGVKTSHIWTAYIQNAVQENVPQET